MPANWEEYNYEPFFHALRTIGYSGTIGLEVSSTDLKHDGPLAMQLLHQALQ
jgi:hydroxypyruvate isomerase